MTAPAPESKPAPLPVLRDELRLIPGKTDAAGEIAWRIYDPLQHRYIEIDSVTVEILSLWRSVNTAEDLRQELERSKGIAVTPEAIDGLVRFAYSNYLTFEQAGGHWTQLADQARRSEKSWGSWLLHNYLFFRVPLAKPQRFLDQTLTFVEPFFSRRLHVCFGVLGLVGLYLVSRQWDQFLNTFQHFFTFEGAIWFGCALFLVKALHEMGHAYTAVRLGCQVPAIGLAFMMMTPMLYTDVTDAWRLPSRRQRMKIDSAGVAVELLIACLATFLWPFLPEGIIKSTAFVMATSSLLMSLAINLSPFMRFDGYFILSDLVGIPNLQPRAFAVARWKLREALFGTGAPCPEAMPPLRIIGLTLYACATWIYRFCLYLGIAAVVYFHFFKVLGIVLFAVEVAVFLVGPFVSEFKEWYRMRHQIARSRRWLIPAGFASVGVLAACVPWSTRIDMPVVVEPSNFARVYAPRAATISAINVTQGQAVEADTILVTLHSDELEHYIRLAETEIARVKAQLARLTADDTDRENRVVLARELASAASKLQGLRKEVAELNVKAPFTGRVLELNPELHAGRTIGPKEMIAMVGGGGGFVARGYVAEADLRRLQSATAGIFIPENIMLPNVPIAIRDIALKGASSIDIADLASTNGGSIAVQPDQQRRLVPISAVYAVTLAADGQVKAPGQRVRGVAEVHGGAESFAVRLWRQIAKVLIRESGA
jgi:putative peptide zinc metalloprotease protein